MRIRDQYVAAVLKTLTDGASDLPLDDYIDALEDIEDEVRSRLEAAKQDQARQDQGEGE